MVPDKNSQRKRTDGRLFDYLAKEKTKKQDLELASSQEDKRN